MNYYEINKECIKKYDPRLYKELYEVHGGNWEMAEQIETVEARDKTPVIKLTLEGVEYKLNSVYRPKDEAKRWTEQYSFYNYQTIITMFGFGSGLFAKAILEQLQEEGLLLIYEPSKDIFLYALYHYDLTSIFSNMYVRVCVEGINDVMFSIYLKNKFNVGNYKNLIPCHYPKYNEIYLKSYKKFLEAITEAQRYIKVNVNTGKFFSEKIIINTLKNISFFKESISLSDLKEKIPNHVPAVIIAAGPSVEENIECLRNLKGRAVIFAVDRILDYLLEQEFIPDFVVTVDPNKGIDNFSRRENISVPLVCYPESDYEVLNHHIGRKIFGTNNDYTEEFYRCAEKPVPNLRPLGSVALITYNVCIGLGFKKIILVGQDLAYDGDKSHGGNSVELYRPEYDVYVKGITEEKVRSRADWRQFIDTYKDIIALNPAVEIIDAKLKGAKIPGTINMPLGEALQQYCVEEIALEKEDIEGITGFTKEEWEAVQSYMMCGSKELMKIKKKAEKGIKTCKELLLLYQKRYLDDLKINTKMEELKKLNESIKGIPLYYLLDRNVSAISAEELSEAYQFTDNAKENEIKVVNKSKVVYEAILETIEYAKPLMEEAINKVQSC